MASSHSRGTSYDIAYAGTVVSHVTNLDNQVVPLIHDPSLQSVIVAEAPEDDRRRTPFRDIAGHAKTKFSLIIDATAAPRSRIVGDNKEWRVIISKSSGNSAE